MSRGGSRPGAGRKKRYGEKTVAMRVPESMAQQLLQVRQEGAQSLGESIAMMAGLRPAETKVFLPLYSNSVSAGFPSPAEDHVEMALDLNELLIAHPAATFFVRASGDSMINAGIHSGDILIVDRALPVKNKAIIIAAVNGELTVKRFIKNETGTYLMPENDAYPPLEIRDEMAFSVWGVVKTVIHSV
ncbi:LexA family protein [Candidatus Paracaedibacter symbiosus]|uniref:LexA family protein n=1 Tax=Candidatus Paracaedibacter symbiosus TaxID=244582 RepID=UPI000509E395|nr:translesion error-prone DNA polymerase V autoproteolytic subunit [Candidatus Paracaedibacter symbiosus]